jgi:hypothetical protein
VNDYSTHTEADAGISAALDCYPDPPPIERYELHDEDPHQWPQVTRGPLLDAFDRAVTKAREARRDEWTAERERRVLDVVRGALCDLCGTHAATEHGLCTACAAFLRSDS